MREAVEDGKDQERADGEHDERVAAEAVDELAGGGEGLVFGDGEGVHVAHAAPVEVAGGGMVDGMVVAPLVVGGEGDQPGEDAPEVVEAAGFEEGAVPAVVEDDEQAHHEAGGDDRQGEGEPVGDAQAVDHEHPEGDVGDEGVGELPITAAEVGLLVGFEDFL